MHTPCTLRVPCGTQVVAIESSKLVRLLGKVENTERFTQLALFQGRAKLTAAMLSSGAKARRHRLPPQPQSPQPQPPQPQPPQRQPQLLAAASAACRRRRPLSV